MKKQFIIILGFIVYSNLYGQLKPIDAISHLTRGINLGNTLECDSLEGQWKKNDPAEWSDNGPASEYYFDAYKNAGFQSVRIPVTWDSHTSTTSPYTIDPTWMARVEQIVDWALDRNMYVILNAHHETWLKTKYSDLQNQARFDSIWSQVSRHFKNKPESLLFEILNEPNGMTLTQINELNNRVLWIIRKSNPTRIVSFSGNGWANVDDLIAANIPNDDYIIGYYHSYDPWPFSGLGQGKWGSATDLTDLQARMDKAKAWSDSHKIPVIISEFGTDSICDYNSRMLYLSNYVEEAAKRNLAFCIWDDGGTFNVYRRKTKTWHETKDIFINFTLLSPNQLKLSQEVDTINFSWNNRIANADSIQIERRTTSTVFNKIKTLIGTTNSYSDKNLVSEDYYYYRILVYRNDSVFYSYPKRIFLIPNESKREPFNGTVFQIPCTFQAEDFDKGGYGLTYFDSDFINATNKYRTDKGVDIDTVNGNSYALVNNYNGEWYDYSINVPKTADYEISTYIGSSTGKGNICYYYDGLQSLSKITQTGSFSILKSFPVVVNLTSGKQIIRLYIYSMTGKFIIDSIGIKEPTFIQNIETESTIFALYPNNAQSEINVYSKDITIKNADLTIYSSNGIIKYEMKDKKLPFVLNIENVISGVYFIKIKSDKNIQTLQFIKN